MTEVKKVQVIEGTYMGRPYRGPVIHLKDTDDIDQMLRLNQKLQVRRFDLSDEKDLKDYTQICQDINDAKADLSVEERAYVPEKQNWVVLLRWIEEWYSPAEEPKK